MIDLANKKERDNISSVFAVEVLKFFEHEPYNKLVNDHDVIDAYERISEYISVPPRNRKFNAFNKAFSFNEALFFEFKKIPNSKQIPGSPILYLELIDSLIEQAKTYEPAVTDEPPQIFSRPQNGQGPPDRAS